jgi:hypothetical protein
MTAPKRAEAAKSQSQRPLPTFGLRLGLIIAFMLLGVAPLLRFYISFRLNAGQEEVLWRIPFDFWTKVVGLGAITTLIATVFAWRGFPPAMHWIFQLVIVCTLLAICLETAVRYYGVCEGCTVIGINQDFLNRAFRVILPLQVLTVVYLLWYMNREPVKVFYKPGSGES